MPTPDSVIAKVDAVWKKQNQGREFIFTYRRNELFGWNAEVQEDDSEFQCLLEQEEEPYPDISTELPGIKLERNQTKYQPDGHTDAIDDEPGPLIYALAITDKTSWSLNRQTTWLQLDLEK